MNTALDELLRGKTDADRCALAAMAAVKGLMQIASGVGPDGEVMGAAEMSIGAVATLAVIDVYLPDPLDPETPEPEEQPSAVQCVATWDAGGVTARCPQPAIGSFALCELHKCAAAGCAAFAIDSEDVCLDH